MLSWVEPILLRQSLCIIQYNLTLMTYPAMNIFKWQTTPCIPYENTLILGNQWINELHLYQTSLHWVFFASQITYQISHLWSFIFINQLNFTEEVCHVNYCIAIGYFNTGQANYTMMLLHCIAHMAQIM